MIKQLYTKFKFLLRSKPVVHILSDSHGEAFKFINWTKFKIKPSYCIVQGATASGLANPNSQTKALPTFQNYLIKNVKPIDYIIFQLGEIDCGFTIWLRAEKKGLKITEQLNYTINNYSSLLVKANKSIKTQIIVTSAVPPTIEDNQNFGEIANLRREIKATQLERTKLTIKFNTKLKKTCNTNQYTFINLDKTLINQETQVVSQQFKNIDKLDHHLNPQKFAKLLEDELSKIL